jgi:acyl-CoA synthetase (NDP forming)
MDSQNLIIVCPHCKEKISIEEALSHQVAAKISAKAKDEIRHEMIKEIKGYRLLEGYRGKKGVDIKKITDLIIKISNLAIKEKNILSLDFNPIMANDKKVLVADFRLII